MEDNQTQKEGVMPVQVDVKAAPAAPVSATEPVAPAPVETAAPAAPSITLDQLIGIAIEQDASDIHFGEGSRIALRVGGKFVFIENISAFSKEETESIVFSMLPNEAEQRRLETVRELDFSYIHSTGVSFRVNAYYSRGRLTASMRMISKHLPTLNELGVPEVMKKFLNIKQGLVLITGTTGSGKSTTTQAMLEYVNENFVSHVITIENPIEHIFKENKSIFSQRELGKDTLTFSNALHSASREDPNIVMVSEINDRETLDAVLNLVEMGHLVIASMTTKNALQTIEHVISMYPQEDQSIMLDRFSDNLACILSQDLLDRIDMAGRAAVFEIMIANKAIKNIIRHNSLSQLRTAMESGIQEGMILMDTYAYQLAERGFISKDDAQAYVPEVN